MQLFDNIIDSSNYASLFKGSLNLDINFSGTSTVDIDKISHFANFITEIQEDLFRELFGEALYNYLYDNKSGQVYSKLRDGEIITDNGYKYEWVGLKVILSNFVFFYFKRDKEGFDTTLGEMKGNTQNSSSANNQLRNKLIKAWNKGVEYYRDAIDYIDYKNEQSTDYYPEFLPNYDKYYQYLENV